MTNWFCFLISIAAAAASYLALSNWSRQKKRTWDDYYPHLREFDWQEARALFDRDEEDRLKALRDRRRFRRSQRARLDLAVELVGRAYHDSRLSREWVNTEWGDMVDHHLEYEPAVIEAMRTLRKESAAFQWIALYCLAYMRLMTLLHFDQWRFMPVPSIVARRKVFGEDLLQAYDRVRQATATFARLAYSDEEAEFILAKM